MEPYLAAKEIIQILRKEGFVAYFAGGWVRDFLMKHPSNDIDIASSALPKQIQDIFPKTIPVGIQFGIVIIVHGGHHFEVATFRKDLEYKDGRRPVGIEISNAEEDAKRRDFTINGLFFDPIEEKVLDFIEGKKDIDLGLIRCIGNPHERFKEDKLRMMRAVRYATRFAFSIDPDTLDAIRVHAKELISSVAMERIHQEFKKMHLYQKLSSSLVLMQEIGLLEQIFPNLKDLSPQEISKRLTGVSSFPKEAPMIAVILELFLNSSLEEKLEICMRLKASTDEIRFTESLHKAEELSNMPKSWQDGLELYDWVQFYADHFSFLCLEIIFTRKTAAERNLLLEEHRNRIIKLMQPISRQRTKNYLLKAEDLLPFNIKPSKYMGELLKEGERIAVNLQLSDKNIVLEHLQKSPIWQSTKNVGDL